MLDPKDTYLKNVTTPSTITPIDWNAITMTSASPGATAPEAVPTAKATTTSAKDTFISNTASSAVDTFSKSNPATYANDLSKGGGTAVPTGTQYDYIDGKAVPRGEQPQTPAAGPDTSAADAAFKLYLDSLGMSPEHTAAQDYLNKLITQQKNDIAAVDNHAGQTTSFAGAEKERINYGANNAIDAASRALGVFEQSDKIRADQGKARYDYEAGKVKAAADALDKAKVDQPEIVKEFEYAKKNGYTGSFEDYQNEDANRKRSTTAAPKQTNAEKTAEGYSVINQLLRPGARIAGSKAGADGKGIPYLDSDGYITSEGLDTLIAAAQSDGISRADFLKEFGVFISTHNNFNNYHLTNQEKGSLLKTGI